MKSSLQTIFHIVRKEFLQVRQDKRMMIVSVMVPVVQVLLLGYAATVDVNNIDMVVCDLDKTAVSREFVRSFVNSRYFIHRYDVNDHNAVDEYIAYGKARIALVIPPGFGEKIVGHVSAPVQVILDGTDANTASVLLGYSTQVVNQYSQSVLAEYLSLSGGLQRAPARVLVEPRVWFNPDLLSSNYMVPGVVAMVLMIITMTLTSLGIVKEKEIGTLEQLMVTPIKPYQLILGKLIPFTVIGFLDVTLVISIAHFWFEVPMRGHIVVLYGLSGLFILTTLGLGLFVSTISRTQQQAMLIAQFFFFMPFMFLSGFTFPIANMPKIVQYLTYLIPLRYFLEIVRGVFLKGIGMRELWPHATILFLFGIAILALSVQRFKQKLE